MHGVCVCLSMQVPVVYTMKCDKRRGTNENTGVRFFVVVAYFCIKVVSTGLQPDRFEEQLYLKAGVK